MAMQRSMLESMVAPMLVSLKDGILVPILRMPLISDLSLARGVGVAAFTRSTIGTFVDLDDGLVKTAAIDEARFETNGVLIEGVSTNILTRSEELDNAAWSKFNLSISANVSTAPDGLLTADKVIPSAINNTKFLRQLFTPTAGVDYTQSLYAKSNGYDFIQIAFGGAFTSAIDWVNINLSTGEIGNIGAGLIGRVTIQSLGNGWFRISATSTAQVTTLDGLQLQVLPTDINSRNPSFIGDGTSGVDMWGLQLEELPFASSYIATAATSVTRTADNLSIDAANIPAPALAYSVSADADLIGLGDADQFGRALYNMAGESFRLIRVWENSTNLPRSFHGNNPSNDFINGGISDPNTLVKYAVTFNSIQSELFQDGLSQGINIPGGPPVGTKSSIQIGKAISTDFLFGHVKDLRIYDVALTDSQVASL